MQKTWPADSAAAVCVLIVALSMVGVANAQTDNNVLTVTGSMVVTGPAAKSAKRTASGEQVAFGRKDIRVQDLKIESEAQTFRGQKIDPQSPEVKRAIEEAVQAMSGTVEIPRQEADKLRLNASARQNAEGIPIKASSKALARAKSVSFSYSGSGEQPVAALTNRQLKAATGKAEWDGTITNFRTTVKQLQPLNGTTAKVHSSTTVSQVDVAGGARGEVQFTVEFQGRRTRGD